MADDPTIAEQAVNRWRAHLTELDEAAMMDFAVEAKSRVRTALDVPSVFIDDVAGAYSQLGDPRWAGSLIVRTKDHSVEVLVERDPADSAGTAVGLVAIVDGAPVGPPFEDQLGLGRALEERLPYDE